MKIENDAMRDLFKLAGKCSLCEKACPQGRDPHHVMTRGAGGSDVRIGLISICRECHSTKVDSKNGTDRCWAEIARREKATVDEIKTVCYFIANQLDKHDSPRRRAEKIQQWDAPLTAKSLLLRELNEAVAMGAIE